MIWKRLEPGKYEGFPFIFDNRLTFDRTSRLQFHRHLIEVPRSALRLV
uniref:Uncharacterized protein n=1 Tax=Siphoviridae sp. ctXOZ1 TaxID=2823585 RepID=A0A8S5LBB9_9CAUD|nr:MAG TPA: hypothetical protein [Siphoviridae sp. ctXOZ1]